MVIISGVPIHRIFTVLLLIREEKETKVAELLPLKVYPITLISYIKLNTLKMSPANSVDPDQQE